MGAGSLPLPGTVPFEEYAPRYLHIRTKRAKVVPFEPNLPQRRLLAEIAESRSSGRPVRLLILKARQLGFSTLSLGLAYEHVTSNKATQALIAAHDDDSTVDLFEKIRLMHDLAPWKPMTRYSNRRELDFSNPDRRTARTNPGLMSKITVGTAGKINLGRSKTLRYVHCSEVAFWDKADRVLLSLEQAIPDDSDSIEIIESTANGVGGEFYRRWKQAENPDTRGDWRAVFFPWFEDPEYRRPLVGGVKEPVPSSVVDIEGFEREERELSALHGLDETQLNWRRWAITNRCGNKLDLFNQEYPSTPEEAFLTTGRPVFNRQLLSYRKRTLEAEDLRRRAEKRPARGIRGRLLRKGGAFQFVTHPEGELVIYKLPVKGHEYLASADTAEGIVKGPDPDAGCIQVFDRHTWEQVAVWHGRVPVAEFTQAFEFLGWFFNKAVLAPESNNHGHTVVTILQQRHYPRIYLRQEFDVLAGEILEKPGWETNQKTRPMSVDALDAAVNTRLLVLNDIPTIDEMLTFVRDPKKGRPQGDVDCHDDRVMASAIGAAILDWGPRVATPASKLDLLKNLDPITAAAARDVVRHRRRLAELAEGAA